MSSKSIVITRPLTDEDVKNFLLNPREVFFKTIVIDDEKNKLLSQPVLTNIEIGDGYTTKVNPDTKET